MRGQQLVQTADELVKGEAGVQGTRSTLHKELGWGALIDFQPASLSAPEHSLLVDCELSFRDWMLPLEKMLLSLEMGSWGALRLPGGHKATGCVQVIPYICPSFLVSISTQLTAIQAHAHMTLGLGQGPPVSRELWATPQKPCPSSFVASGATEAQWSPRG